MKAMLQRAPTDRAKDRIVLDRERRQQAHARMAQLRALLHAARIDRKAAMRSASERCRAERLATRERVRALRMRGLAELREATRLEREAARKTCAEGFRAARSKEGVERRRAELAAEARYRADLERSVRADRARRRQHPHAPYVAGTPESDDAVRAALPSALVPFFEATKRQITPKGRMTRVEAVLRHAETHPEEVLAAAADPTDTRVRALEDEHRVAAKACGCSVPNPYEARKAARVERMRARAERLAAASEGARAVARATSDRIPLGQPILIGHHSEKRHRRDLARIQKNFTKSVELGKEARALERRADYAESNRAISSDDPDALQKLRGKIEELDFERTRMRMANTAMRSKRPREDLAKLGYSPAEIKGMFRPDELGRTGFPDYRLTNAASESRRLKKRLSDLEDRATKLPPAAVTFPGGRIDEADNRVRVMFDAKPAEDVRTALKKAGFRWSPKSGAWQRHASTGAWYEAKRIVGLPTTAPAAAGAAPGRPAEVLVRPPAATSAARSETSPNSKRAGGDATELAKRGMTRSVMAIVRNAAPGEAHIAWEKEKAAAVRLEKAGLVTIRRTTDRTGGLLDWWVRLTPKGARAEETSLANLAHAPVANANAAAPSVTPPAAKPVVQGEGLDTTAIAKRIRDDIKAAVYAGKLPALATYSVRTSKYSMGSSITVVASKLPFPVLNPNTFVVERGASWVTVDRTNHRSRFTPEAQEVERTLNEIVDAYHWDRSDSMTDYYNERFHRDVRIEEEKGEYRRMETAKLAAARAEEGRG